MGCPKHGSDAIGAAVLSRLYRLGRSPYGLSHLCGGGQPRRDATSGGDAVSRNAVTGTWLTASPPQSRFDSVELIYSRGSCESCAANGSDPPGQLLGFGQIGYAISFFVVLATTFPTLARCTRTPHHPGWEQAVPPGGRLASKQPAGGRPGFMPRGSIRREARVSFQPRHSLWP